MVHILIPENFNLALFLKEGDIGGCRTPQYRRKYRQIPLYRKKNRQISQYRIESRWNTEIAKTWYIIHIMLSSWQELRGLGFSFV